MDKIESLNLKPASNGFILSIQGRRKDKANKSTYDGGMSWCSEEEVFGSDDANKATARMTELAAKMFGKKIKNDDINE